ncbi:MAG: lysophospholipid acyltransferase family protein [Chloroflexi bacterium]|nr:lysophospholipid acyltransferase family protein [Chloroflexota bacterium]
MTLQNTNHKISTLGYGSGALQRLGQFLLRLIGWKVDAQLPADSKVVLIVAPHTSNWDLPIGLICAFAIGLMRNWHIGYMVKDSATRWPVIGQVIRWFGAIPINRSAAQNVVDQMVAAFKQYDRLLLGITPEGTRKKVAYWKSGFYQIALKAQVPIALAYLDYGRKVGGVGPTIVPTGNMEADLEIIRQFYAGIAGKFPHQFGEIQFRPNGL